MQGAGPSTRDTINTLNSLNPLKRRFLPHQGKYTLFVSKKHKMYAVILLHMSIVYFQVMTTFCVQQVVAFPSIC